MKSNPLVSILLVAIICLTSCSPPAGRPEGQAQWEDAGRETKPWTRWWWHGSAVTREGITAELEAYKEAGIGGLEITPIYGVYGEEQAFVKFLSPEWMDLLTHVLKEAERLDLGIDMATGTGWPFGGPWVGDDDACKNIQYKLYNLRGGEQLSEKIEFIQEPYLRLVGNNIYESRSGADGSASVPVRVFDTGKVTIKDIAEPVSANQNLQQLAIDQIQFKRALELVALMAYSEQGEKLDLMPKVCSDGRLNWTAPSGNWELYAIFEGFHGKMVERAGPGGEGNVIDHFSEDALRNYLSNFDKAFQGRDITTLRAFFNDSYEVDDARGAADFTGALFEEFKQRRGYDLREELPALFGRDEEERNQRVLSDYRETISDLLLEKFTTRWKAWAHSKDAIVRNQAHGSPSNILDLYTEVDIPEIEGVEPLRIKMASSAGNVSGKRLVSAEAATWLNEHFESSLGDIRESLDNFMLNGVNHLVYHGSCYSPADEPWPGRLFYAAVHLNPRNPQWKDFHALNRYVTRCQSFLQASTPDNDILLYYPIYDRFSARGPEMVEHFDGIGGFKGSSFEKVAEEFLESGYGFDYISDKQLRLVNFKDGKLFTQGRSAYRVIVVPECTYMPLETLGKLRGLAEEGAQVIFAGSLPKSVNGLHAMDSRKKAFAAELEKIRTLAVAHPNSPFLGSLAEAGARREPMVAQGIRFLRKRNADGSLLYFVKNESGRPFEGWLPLTAEFKEAIIFDPMDERKGLARVRKNAQGGEVYVQMGTRQSLMISGQIGGITHSFPYRGTRQEEIALQGMWKVTFISGGPALPPPFESDALQYWTDRKESVYQDFSGTASYTISFARPQVSANQWVLKIDSVRSTAEVVLNGTSIGTLIGPPFEIDLDPQLLRDKNTLEIRVANLMANRIAYLDRNGIFWKKFYNINFAARLRENARNNIFDASKWPARPSGLAGGAYLFPFKD